MPASKSLIGILTYRRVAALQETLRGIAEHCPQYDCVISEDCGQADLTESFLMGPQPVLIKDRRDLLAKEYSGAHLGKNVRVLLGDTNLGVTGNSNRLLKIFEEGGYDHLCLLNDDLHVLGDFVNFYKCGHTDLGVGLWCLCDFTSASPAISGPPETYKWITVNSRGHRVKLLSRMTGIMMSISRPCFEAIGYYDARFRTGEEHCDYTIRARLAGFVSLDGQPQNALDLEASPPVLKHQDCETSLGRPGSPERLAADQEAGAVMKEVSSHYGQEPVYRPFRLRLPKTAAGLPLAGISIGIPTTNLSHYAFVDAPV